jgi:hypothetical protein
VVKGRPVHSRLAVSPVSLRVLPVSSRVSDPMATAVIVATAVIAATASLVNPRRACRADRMRIDLLQRRLLVQRLSVPVSIATDGVGRGASACRRSIATSVIS